MCVQSCDWFAGEPLTDIRFRIHPASKPATEIHRRPPNTLGLDQSQGSSCAVCRGKARGLAAGDPNRASEVDDRRKAHGPGRGQRSKGTLVGMSGQLCIFLAVWMDLIMLSFRVRVSGRIRRIG